MNIDLPDRFDDLLDLLTYACCPRLPPDPGLYALVAPDGITIRIFPHGTDQEIVADVAHHDLHGRVMRDRYFEFLDLDAEVTDDLARDIARKTAPERLRKKLGYRLEKL